MTAFEFNFNSTLSDQLSEWIVFFFFLSFFHCWARDTVKREFNLNESRHQLPELMEWHSFFALLVSTQSRLKSVSKHSTHFRVPIRVKNCYRFHRLQHFGFNFQHAECISRPKINHRRARNSRLCKMRTEFVCVCVSILFHWCVQRQTMNIRLIRIERGVCCLVQLVKMKLVCSMPIDLVRYCFPEPTRITRKITISLQRKSNFNENTVETFPSSKAIWK